MSTETKYTIAKLNSNNYFNWRYKLQMLLIEKDVWEVIDEEEPTPITNAWRRKDRKALATIALHVEDDQIQHIRNCLTAVDAWHCLKEIHEKDTPNNRVSILRKMMTTNLQEGGDVEKYLSEMNELYQKMIAMGNEFKPDFIMSAILLGSLPESYNGLVQVLEGRSEELTKNLVYSKVLEEYKRRKEKVNGKDKEGTKTPANFDLPTAMISKFEKICNYCKEKGHFKRNCGKYVEWLEQRVDKTNVEQSEKQGQDAHFTVPSHYSPL